MKATEIIERLHSLVAAHGDREVRIWNDLEMEFDSINEIEARRFLSHQRATDEERSAIFFGIDPYSVGDEYAQLRYDNRNPES